MADITSQVKPELRAFVVNLKDFKMGQQIGTGGFGEVFLATHVPTGKKCAIKRLFAKELKGSDLDLFIREIENLALCDNMFCLPFLGCTLKYPFSIITQYIPRGSLFNALKHKEGSPDLSGTDKTLIAMGIARGMEYLHKKHIIHRDLKSLNILLDDRLLPIICDFGLSRQDKEEEFKTKDVGTPHWMAPELIETRTYSTKVDVYSFGMLMWEMLTESAPFKGMTTVQILYAVLKKKERPPFPSITPKPMKNFINKCWDQDPEKRPTMEEIYREFKEGKIAFNGTDREEIIKFAKFIKRDESQRAKAGEYKKPPLSARPRSTSRSRSSSSISPRSPSNSPRPGKTQSFKATYSILKQPTSPEFPQGFTKACAEVKNNKDLAGDFFHYVSRIFINKTADPPIYKLILQQLITMIDGENTILYEMLKTGMYYFLPFDNSELLNMSMIIILISVTTFPMILNTEFLQTIDPVVSECPEAIIKILTLYFRPGDHQKSIWNVCEFIRKHADTFLNNCGVTFLRFIYSIFSTNASVRAVRLEDLVAIVTKAVTMPNLDIVHNAYCCICALFDQRIVIDQITIIQHLKNSSLQVDAASYLARQPNIQVTPELLDALIEIAPKEKMALISLYNIVSKHKIAGQIMVDTAERWMLGNTFKPIDVISLILILVNRKSLRPLLAQCQMFAEVLSGIPETCDLELIDISSKIIIKMIDEQQLFTNLSKYGYFEHYFTVIPKLNNSGATKTSIYIIDTLARKYYISGFLYYIPVLFQMLKTNTDYTFPALSAITVLSSYQQVCELIKTYPDYKVVIKQLGENQAYKVYIASLHKNLTTY